MTSYASEGRLGPVFRLLRPVPAPPARSERSLDAGGNEEKTATRLRWEGWSQIETSG